ncbi:hypothetical protein D3C86_1754420 [compost metagenome]
MQIILPGQQRLFDPDRALAKQGPAPEDVAQQVSVEQQQPRLSCAGPVLPLQLSAGNGRNVGQARIAWVLLDEPADIFVHQNAAEMRLQFGREPTLATGFGTGEHQDFHVRNTGSARHSRQPCTAIRANSA